MIRVGDRVRVKPGSSLSSPLLGVTAGNTGLVKAIGPAGNAAVLFDGCSFVFTMALQDLELSTAQAVGVTVVSPFPITFMGGEIKIDVEHKCDCGAEKANTTHANWCSTRKA